MLDEHSKLVGTTKALGFYNKEVLRKYRIFGVLGTMIGVLLGILIAYFLLQPLVLHMYAPYYTVPEAKKAFELGKTLIVIAGGLLLSELAVRLACSRLMKSTAISLMQGADPVSKRKKENGTGRKGGSLYTRLILLNMTSDLKRVIVTIISIAGCCILLMIGFSLKYGMDRVPDRQYGGVLKFDAELTYDSEISSSAASDLARLLDELGTEYTSVYQGKLYFPIDDGFSTCTVISAEPEALQGYYYIENIKGKEELDLTEHGVLVSKRMHEKYDINTGDSFAVHDASLNRYDTSVAGVFNNYFGHLVFISPGSWQEIFGDLPKENCFFVKLNGITMDELQVKTQEIPGFSSLKDASSNREQMKGTAAAMNVLIILMIVMAALMAYFILINLTGSYMIHKKKELTIMRINGFTTKECTRYAATELIITSVLGIVIGLLTGAGLSYLITRLVEQSFLQMVRTVDWRSVVFSALITALFSLIINAYSLRTIKNLKLSDVA